MSEAGNEYGYASLRCNVEGEIVDARYQMYYLKLLLRLAQTAAITESVMMMAKTP